MSFWKSCLCVHSVHCRTQCKRLLTGHTTPVLWVTDSVFRCCCFHSSCCCWRCYWTVHFLCEFSKRQQFINTLRRFRTALPCICTSCALHARQQTRTHIHYIWLFVGKLLVFSVFMDEREKSAEFFDPMWIFAFHFISNVLVFFYYTAHRFIGSTAANAMIR